MPQKNCEQKIRRIMHMVIVLQAQIKGSFIYIVLFNNSFDLKIAQSRACSIKSTSDIN